jgi:hypothetical protein
MKRSRSCQNSMIVTQDAKDNEPIDYKGARSHGIGLEPAASGRATPAAEQGLASGNG